MSDIPTPPPAIAEVADRVIVELMLAGYPDAADNVVIVGEGLTASIGVKTGVVGTTAHTAPPEVVWRAFQVARADKPVCLRHYLERVITRPVDQTPCLARWHEIRDCGNR